MSKKTPLPQRRRHIFVFDEDWEYVRDRFGEELGLSNAIRNMIHRYVVNLRAQESRSVDAAAVRAPEQEISE